MPDPSRLHIPPSIGPPRPQPVTLLPWHLGRNLPPSKPEIFTQIASSSNGLGHEQVAACDGDSSKQHKQRFEDLLHEIVSGLCSLADKAASLEASVQKCHNHTDAEDELEHIVFGSVEHDIALEQEPESNEDIKGHRACLDNSTPEVSEGLLQGIPTDPSDPQHDNFQIGVQESDVHPTHSSEVSRVKSLDFSVQRTISQLRKQTISQLFQVRSDWSELDEETLSQYDQRFDNLFFQSDKDRSTSELENQLVSNWMKEDSQHSRFVLHPSGPPRIIWHITCLVFIVYDLVTVPLLAFEIPDSDILTCLDWLCTICWSFDILVAFRTGYFQHSQLEMRPEKIAKHYLRTWLSMDLLIVCSDWVTRFVQSLPVGGSILRTARVFRMVRCIRLLRIAKVMSLWNIIENQLNSNIMHLVMNVLKVTAGLIVIVHFISCCWYAIGNSEEGWTTYYSNAFGSGDGLVFWYFASSRWTLAQINGRTDMDERRNLAELLYTVIIAIVFAVIFMAIFISSVTTTMMELNALAETRTSLERLVNRYLSRQHVSSQLVGSVKHHMAAQSENTSDSIEDESKVMALLPEQLAHDLLYEVRTSVLARHTWFSTFNSAFPRLIRHICNKATSLLCPHSNEIVFDRGDSCNRLLFVDTGLLLYASAKEIDLPPPEPKTHKRCSENVMQRSWSTLDHVFHAEGSVLRRCDWLSEPAIWVEWINRGRLLAGLSCCLVVLETNKFSGTLKEYRSAYAMSILYARSFVANMKAVQDLSDLPFTVMKM